MRLVIISTLGAGKQALLEDPGVPRLIECRDAKLLICVLLNNTQGVLMGVEGRHENEGNIDPVARVKVLYLTHGEVEEGHIILDFQCALGTSHAYEPSSK